MWHTDHPTLKQWCSWNFKFPMVYILHSIHMCDFLNSIEYDKSWFPILYMFVYDIVVWDISISCQMFLTGNDRRLLSKLLNIYTLHYVTQSPWLLHCFSRFLFLAGEYQNNSHANSCRNGLFIALLTQRNDDIKFLRYFVNYFTYLLWKCWNP